MTIHDSLSCTCGRVRLAIDGAPIVSAECHCSSCRTAAVCLEARPAAPLMRSQNGGTRLVLYRKDRVQVRAGEDLLREFRVLPESKTRRVVASCCNTPVFLEFQGGHWLSVYGAMWGARTPPVLELRTMTGDRQGDVPLDNDAPNLRGHSGRFFAKLIGAWIAMGFRSPTLPVFGALDA